jgi:SAM-dependent methyltransferase
MNASPTAYDTFPYASAIYSQTHPDRLATLTALHGLQPCDVTRARVLELGCGDGLNLIAMAVALPDVRFTGIDLASTPITRGQDILRRLGLRNVDLAARDVLALPDDLGQFDFIIAHGLYSWVPAPVREKVLAICSHSLAPDGVAYISYNAQPGNHFRDLARGLMRFHAGRFATPDEKIEQARSFLEFLAGHETADTVYRDVLRQQFARIEKYLPSGVFHDDLSECNQAFYFHEFISDARRHGLDFLTEADYADTQTDGLSQECVRVLDRFGPDEVVAREQYLDFFRARAFRQTLLCHAGRKVSRPPSPESVFPLLVASTARPSNPKATVTTRQPVEFKAGNNSVIATEHPLVKAALMHLGARWPERIPFQALLDHAASATGESASENRLPFAKVILATHAIGFVELHTFAGGFTTAVSTKPCASSLARLQAPESAMIPTLRHTTLHLGDELSRKLVPLLDGTRTHEELVDALAGQSLPAGTSNDRRFAIRQEIATGMDNALTNLARGAILVS